MIPRECKRLAEVDFPVAEVSKHSAREKSIRHGHPSTLHLWWARRPLAACRAMLMALLLPDPSDPHCPDDFKQGARQLLRPVSGDARSDEQLRAALLKFIADFANWDNAAKPAFLECARGLVKAAHEEEPPLVVDPFAGGGSIPLEALRLGCDAFAGDLNPVACLILKVLLEDIPRQGPALAEELRRSGNKIREHAEKELAQFYPRDPDGSRPIAYLWARTVRCEAPNCGMEIPLVRSFWLSTKSGRKRALRHRLVKADGDKVPPDLEFEVFTPKADEDVPPGTVRRARVICPANPNHVLTPERVRAQLCSQHGGADVSFDNRGKRIGGARLLVIILQTGEQGRTYRVASPHDYVPLWRAHLRFEEINASPNEEGMLPVPNEPLPLMSGTFNVPLYGMDTWGKVFSSRQKVALETLTRLTRQSITSWGLEAIALALTRIANAGSSLSRWDSSRESHQAVYARQALGMVWDFSEANPLSDATGGYARAVEWIAAVAESWPGSLPAQIQLADAVACPLVSESAAIWFTDPPYYFAVPYADLSDFFFVWLKRALPGHPLMRDPFDGSNPLTPKERELCEMAHWDKTRYSHKNQQFFEEGMAGAFQEGHRVVGSGGIGCLVFAHKTTEGWEALLSGMIRGKWIITGSWPVATEMTTRLRARDSAALATSVHLIARPRETTAGIGDWAGILRDLGNRVADWMERLSGEGIRGADLVFSCIGPALELFSKYDRVETAEGREVRLSEFLEKVWEVVGRTALQQILGTAEARARNSAAGALEEDARLTALFLWTIQSTAAEAVRGAESGEEDEEVLEDDEDGDGKSKKGYTLIYDVVRRFAQPLGIHLESWEERIIETKKGVVRLLPVSERTVQLFGPAGSQNIAAAIERSRGRDTQYMLFPEEEPRTSAPARRRRRRTGVETETPVTKRAATTLDRVHAAMLLQANGHASALRSMLQAEIERGPDFLRLANALSALYPKESEEKRLLDAMLLAVPRR